MNIMSGILSIIITICDKDYFYLDSLLSDITTKVKVPFEVIIVDNRNNQTDKLPDFPYKYISKGYNTYNFEGRRLGLDIASNEYVWFVDADDNLYEDITEKLFSTADIIQNNFKINGESSFIRRSNNLRDYGPSLCCRFFKRTFITSLLKSIKRDIKLVNFENNFIFELAYQNTKSIKINDNIIYVYNIQRSQKYNGYINQDQYNHIFIGLEYLPYLLSFLPDPSFLEKNMKDEISFINHKLRKEEKNYET